MREYSARAMGFNPTEEKNRRKNLIAMALSIFSHAYEKNCPINDREIAMKYYSLGTADGYTRGYTEGLGADIREFEKEKQEKIVDVIESDPHLRRSEKFIDL